MRFLQALLNVSWGIYHLFRNAFLRANKRETKKRFCNFKDGKGCSERTRYHVVIRKIASNELVGEAFFCAHHHPAKNEEVHATLKGKGEFAHEINLHLEP